MAFKDGNDDVAVYNTFSTTFSISSPKLTVSMRASNTNKRDNLNNIRALIEPLRATKTDMSIAEKWSFIGDNLEVKYTQDESGVHGEKVQGSLDSSDLDLMLSTLKEGETIGFIYDNTESDTYKMLNSLPSEKKDKIEFFTEDSAQGSEAKYFIVDVDWSKKRTMNGETAEASIEVADFIKSLYTIATRSEEGTIIIDNHLTEVVNPNAFVESDYNAPTSYTDESLADYKEKRLRALEEILKGYTPSNPAIAPVVPGGQPVTNEPVIVPKLREGTWIQMNDGSKWRIMSVDGTDYVLATQDKTEYHKQPIEQIDTMLGVSVHLSTEPTKPVILPEGGKRPDLQQVLIEEAQASEEGVESDLEAQKKAQWYAKDDPGFKVYTFAGYRSGIGLEMSQGSVAVDADNNVNIINSGRKYKSTSGELVDETKSDLQALLDLDTFRNGSVKVPFNTYNTATTLLADVRSAVMFAKTNGAALSNVKKLVREFPPASKIASATTGELQVKYVNAFYQQTDQTVEMGDKTTPNRKLVVYTLKDRSGNPVAEFTIGVLPGEFTLDNWVQNYVGEDKNIRSKWQRLSKLLADGNEVAKNARRTVYIPLGTNFALGPNIILTLRLVR